jgi:hypothetical protein
MKTNLKGLLAVAKTIFSSSCTRFCVVLLSCLLWTSVGWGQTTDSYTTAGTFTWVCPSGVTSVQVQAWGGGGAGGSINATSTNINKAGGGGGGGAFTTSNLTVSPGNSYTIVVGAGGVQGTNNGDGYSSTFNSTSVIAVGGKAGASHTASTSTAMSGGAGGLASACTPTIGAFSGGSGGTSTTGGSSGGGGGSAGSTGAGGNASGVTAGVAGNGGGGIGATGLTSGNTNGSAATQVGGGGSGARAGNTSAKTGGAGGAGQVLLTYTMPPCSGTPSPGNTVASVNPVVSGSSTTLSLQNATTGSGITYQWQSSTDNTTWSNITGATAATYTATPTVATYYRCNVTCSGNTGTSNSIQINILPAVNIPASSFTTINCGTSSIIYDEGGVSSNYANNDNGYVVLNNSGTGVITISGSYSTESGFDYLKIYSGIGTGGTLIASYSGSGNITNYSSSPGTSITLQFISDVSNVSTGIAIQAIYTGVCAACSSLPTSLASSSITSSTATISWTAPASAPANGYEYYFSTSSTAPTISTTISGSTAAGVVSASLSSLTANTTYYYWVRSNCNGTDKGTWVSGGSFTTPCLATTLPLSEGFNVTVNTTNNPACWSQSNVNGSLSINQVTAPAGLGPTGFLPQEGSGMIFYNSYSYSTSTRLVTRKINSTGISNVSVDFQWYYSSSGGSTSYLTEGVTLQWSTDGITWNDFSGNFIRRYGATTGWQTITINLPIGAGNIPNLYIGFLFVGNSGYDCYMDNVVVYATPIPTITSISPTSGCVGSTLTITGTNLTGATAANVKIGGTAVTSISSNSGTSMNVVVGAGTFGTVEVTTSYGTATSASSFTINSLPNPTFTSAPSATSCLGSNVTYTTQSGMTNYIWSFPGASGTGYSIISGGTTSSDNTVTIQWLTTGSKTVTVNYTNANGCTATTATSSISNVLSQPTLTSFSYSNASYCNSLTTSGSPTLTGNNSTGGSYSSSPSGLNINTSTGIINPNLSTAGVYTVTYTIAASGGCSAVTINTNVEILSIPSITTQPSSLAQSICGLNSIPTDLSILASGNGGTLASYQWYSNTLASSSGGTNISGATASNYTPSTTTAGTNYYYVIVSNTNGCSTTSTVSGAITVLNALSGTKTVGSGGDYPTLTAAITAYNNSCLSGPVVFSLTDATYSSGETFPITINANVYASSTNTLTIKPASGVTTNISGSLASSALIKISSNYVTIDGSNTSNGTSRDLSITNTNATSPNVIVIGNSGTSTSNALTNVTLKNTILTNGVNTSSAVLVTNNASAAGYFNNITIQNNKIQKAYIGIYALAAVNSGNGNGLSILNNDLNSNNTDAITLCGIYVQGVDGANISSNNISNITNISYTNSVSGIWLATSSTNCQLINNNISNLSYTGSSGYGVNGINVSAGTSVVNILIQENLISSLSSSGSTTTIGINVSSSNVLINKNYISNVKHTSSRGAYGIGLSNSTSTANVIVTNNQIFDILNGASHTTTTRWAHGIAVTSGGGYNLYNNSVNLNTTSIIATNSSALYIASSVSLLDIRNNIFCNNLSQGSRYSIYDLNSSNTQYTNIDYNDFYSTGTLGYLGTSIRTTLSDIVSGFGGNANSINILPNFTSPTDLHLTLSGNCSLNNAGTPLAGVTTDYDGDTRNTTTPDIGADEFAGVNTASAPSTSPTLCVNTALTAITHTTTGATGIGTATGLPAGVSAAWASNTITISGTPTSAGSFNYSIPLTGGCANVFATGTITVTANNTASVASSTPTLCANTALTAITHTTTGATGISSAGVSGANTLPAGVSATWANNTITISGTPTSAGTFNYSIPLTGGCGSVNATGTITVNALPATSVLTGTLACAGSTGTISSSTSQSGVNYQLYDASNTAVGSAIAGTNSSLTWSSLPIASGYYVIGTDATSSCVSANSSAVAVGTITNKTWTGTTSNDWSTASNWSCGTLPTSSDVIIINTSNPAPVMGVDFTVGATGSLTISGTGSLVISPSKTLTIDGAVNFGANSVTLKSDASGTARIAQITGTLTGATNVTQERYVPGKSVRKWSFLASPVTQRLDSAWQQQIHITGPGTGGTMCNNYTTSGTMFPHSNGFDVTQLQNPSFYTYDAATDNFVANTTGTNNFTLTPGNGYMVLVRGDRNDATNGGCVLLSANNQAAFTSIPVTLTATGAVGQGTITKTIPSGWNLVGNPYPCEIDFTNFATDNSNSSVIENKYWVYYPNTSPANTYSTYSSGTSTNDATPIIANGQSFLVNNNSGSSASITFKEAHKSTTANNGNFRLTKNWDELIRVGLFNNQNNRLDEVVIRFGNDAAITKSINEYDAASVNGGEQWIKTMKDATELAIQTRPNTYQNDTVSLAIHAKNAGTYQLGFSEYQGLSNTEVYLIDQQENLIQNVKALPSYDFSVAANTTTANRFKLIFDAKTSGVGNIASNTQLQVYPNPTKDKVSITCNSLEYGAYQVKVRTITGAEVLQAKGFYKNGDVIELSLNDLAAGMYLLELSQDNGFRATQKITKH